MMGCLTNKICKFVEFSEMFSNYKFCRRYSDVIKKHDIRQVAKTFSVPETIFFSYNNIFSPFKYIMSEMLLQHTTYKMITCNFSKNICTL